MLIARPASPSRQLVSLYGWRARRLLVQQLVLAVSGGGDPDASGRLSLLLTRELAVLSSEEHSTEVLASAIAQPDLHDGGKVSRDVLLTLAGKLALDPAQEMAVALALLEAEGVEVRATAIHFLAERAPAFLRRPLRLDLPVIFYQQVRRLILFVHLPALCPNDSPSLSFRSYSTCWATRICFGRLALTRPRPRRVWTASARRCRWQPRPRRS